MRTILQLAPALVLASSCGGGGAEPTDADAPQVWTPSMYCPGGPDCAESTGPLFAGAATVSVVPLCMERWSDVDGNAAYNASIDTFDDCGCDALCPEDPGYAAADEGEGDGTFQAVWIGGFGNARAANGVRDGALGLRGEGDGLWAKALVLRQGDSTLAIVALDAVGWMQDDAEAMRAAVAAAGHDVDHVLIHSSHVHEAPDTMGIWGQNAVKSGYNQQYGEQVHDQVADVVGLALANLVEVELEVGSVNANDYTGGVGNLISDTRDPQIVDPRVGVARFYAPGSGETVATLVHFANHPETVGSDNLYFTSDFAHALRKTVEEGVQWNSSSRHGVGGTCLFLNAAVGGMMTSLRADVEDPDGVVWSDHTFEKADVVGQILGGMALDALENAQPAGDITLTFRAEKFFLPVVNLGFQAMFQVGVLGHRTIYNYDENQNITADNQPDVQTEVNYVALGPLEMISVPGELLPELAIGGYDGSFTPPGHDIVDADNPLPPDLSAAPDGPYLLDRLGGEHNWVIGLGNDELGYFIPPYNFVVPEVGAFILESDGDHYEETNSLGPDTAPLIDAEVERLAGWAP